MGYAGKPPPLDRVGKDEADLKPLLAGQPPLQSGRNPRPLLAFGPCSVSSCPRTLCKSSSTKQSRCGKNFKPVTTLACGPTTIRISGAFLAGDAWRLLVLENHPRRVGPGCAHDAAAWVGGRAAQVQAANRRAIIGESRNRPEGEELMQRHRPLKDIAARQVERSLEIERRQHLPRQNRALEIRRIFIEQVETTIGKRLP